MGHHLRTLLAIILFSILLSSIAFAAETRGLSLALIEPSLIILLLLMALFIIKRCVDYLVMKHLTAEEKLYIHECSEAIRTALGIIYFPGSSNEKPYHVRRIEDHRRSITYLKSVAVRRLVQRLTFRKGSVYS
jgi:hypothetical protein